MPPESRAHEKEAVMPPLKPSETTLSSRSARAALRALEDFEASPENPRNWASRRKWRTMFTVAMTGFIATTGSSIAVPGIHSAMAEFGTRNEKVGVLVASCYVLGLGAGPFLFAPISELWGRQVAYQSSQVCFTLFCMACALAPNMAALLVLRFFCGVFGSVGPTLGVATCADVFAPHERGRPVSLYALGPMTGPVLGSMLGYWILYGGWRWTHGVMAIMAAANFVLLSFVDETYAPAVQKKLSYTIKHPLPDARGLERLSPHRFLHERGWMRAMVSRDDASTAFKKAFSRPPRLLFGNPVAFIFSLYYAYIYAVLYLFIVSLNLLFGQPPFSTPGLFSYGWPQSTVGLCYLGMTAGFGLSALTAATMQDRIYRRLSKKNGGVGQPEYRLVLTAIGMCIMPCGLFLFGWTAGRTHWIGPQMGQAVTSYGLMLAFNSIQNFIVDAFYPYSAAATASATFARSVTACVLPIFAPTMYRNLGWGWGSTLLALLAAVAIPAPFVMFKYGQRLRERFKFEG
ncbi:putative polyamine transport-related protein [Cutaneotrichosporon oleaginosum]|uniref:Putative polyamine transport-related protein n=1 Tax=Cutaneotrichosporon oleaginosum TaxID=879819 RepID=A0A0J0XLH2_9TREE|nr:putative polyamine transport-related protein [Cutaneotrichosporon oleaginosum]KLT41936.1 putative polyamine transport-related protein [Cutaneotrichosporon oleaginosum]TXT12536.1 hypothetical protein COLE_02946 [Cutaneotrichosporon oleaginosum]